MSIKTPEGLYTILKEQYEARHLKKEIYDTVHHMALIEHYKKQSEVLRELLERLQPMEIVQGDAISHLNPMSNLRCNTSLSWLVTKPELSAHKNKRLLEEINNTLEATAPGKWME